MPDKYEIIYDAYQEAKWFQGLSQKLKSSILCSIDNVSHKPEIERVLRYDRPDIVLLKNDRVVLGLEKTTEVPTGHNVGQRFARIVCSAEEAVPFIYFFPFAAMKHGDYAAPCWVNARLLKAMRSLGEIHQTPILAANWPHDHEYELVRDGTQDSTVKRLVNDLIGLNFPVHDEVIDAVYKEMKRAYDDAVNRYPQYLELPRTAKILPTQAYIKTLKTTYGSSVELPSHFSSRNESLVYTVGMRYVRADPYTGTQLIYDYLCARTGKTPRDRKMNLVLNMPYITGALWQEAYSRPKRKDIRLYTKFADLIVLKDRTIHYE